MSSRSDAQHNDGLSGGPPRFFAIEEPQPGVLLVGTCVRGIARSADNGKTWKPIEGLDHISINTIATAVGGEVLAATSGGLYRSADQGRGWDQLDDEPIYATTPSGPDRPDGLRTFRLVELRDGRTLAGTDGSGVWARCNRGTWAPLGAADAMVHSLAETPSGAILAGTHGDGVLRSDDGGATWEPSSDHLPDTSVHSLAVLADGSILAGTGQGLSRSLDDGRTWQPHAADLDSHRIFSCASTRRRPCHGRQLRPPLDRLGNRSRGLSRRVRRTRHLAPRRSWLDPRRDLGDPLLRRHGLCRREDRRAAVAGLRQELSKHRTRIGCVRVRPNRRGGPPRRRRPRRAHQPGLEAGRRAPPSGLRPPRSRARPPPRGHPQRGPHGVPRLEPGVPLPTAHPTGRYTSCSAPAVDGCSQVPET